jgi:hypothetical protein
MKNSPLYIILFFAHFSIAQTHVVNSKFMTTSESDHFLSDSTKHLFKINSPVLYLYNYSDKSGNYYTVFTQRTIAEYADKDSLPNSIRFLNLELKSGKLISVWDKEINALPDFISGTQTINFNKDLISFSDLDNDSLIDPVISYTTNTKCDIIVFYQKKPFIVELILGNSGQETIYIDPAFYNLPFEIQKNVTDKLDILYAIKPAEFPDGWKNAIQKKKTIIK